MYVFAKWIEYVQLWIKRTKVKIMFQVLEMQNHKLCLKKCGSICDIITCPCFLGREQIYIKYIEHTCTFDFGTRF